jgi:hypothetical protein
VKLRERLVAGFDGLRVSRMPLEKALRSSADNSLAKAGLSWVLSATTLRRDW